MKIGSDLDDVLAYKILEKSQSERTLYILIVINNIRMMKWM